MIKKFFFITAGIAAISLTQSTQAIDLEQPKDHTCVCQKKKTGEILKVQTIIRCQDLPKKMPEMYRECETEDEYKERME